LKKFYSNGKLLLTGEYLVLDGAKALALPTKFGQDLVVENEHGKTIRWKSLDADGSIWFEAEIAFEKIEKNFKPAQNPIEDTLIQILHTALKMNPEFLTGEGYQVNTHLTFPKSWGLGTSSTLINNIAQWLDIDAFELLRESFGGSGYDIACAQNDTAIVYRLVDGKPIVEPIMFNPEFTQKLYFVYLNQKQSSKTAIAMYRTKSGNLNSAIAAVNAIASQIAQSENIQTFCNLLEKHESLLSGILEMPTVRQNLFPDFNGTVKSLGAWGGDFVLAVCKHDPTVYFESKGYKTVIPYSEMIL
jgi:mevalonate kinase